jgi:carboxyl-terminal processing protease
MEGGTSALKLTTATYFVGKDDKKKNIHRFPDSKEKDEWGVKPTEGYEVKLSDEERLNFFRWRQRRDVVRQPGQPAPKAEDNDKVPSDFTDRVVDKALEYIRSEIRKGAAGPGLPPVHDAALPPRPAISGWAYRP